MFATVITTIQEPTRAVVKLVRKLVKCRGLLVVAGDKQGPPHFRSQYFAQPCRIDFLTLADQHVSEFGLARKLPVGSYTRKNVAYLHAIAAGADLLYETDDDNAPLDHWQVRSEYVSEARSVSASKFRWINAYRYFTDELIWPRGFPLSEIHSQPPKATMVSSLRSPIQQGLANGSPDVDAIWRLVLDRRFEFSNAPSVILGPGNWCPFNTQSTWWWPIAYPLLYLPSHCSFRMCDIWKSFVAQRCLWELDCGIAFHAPEVFQDRNQHDSLHDFADEVPGYIRNREIADILSRAELSADETEMSNNLHHCYAALVRAGIFPKAELELLEGWLQDLRVAVANGMRANTSAAV
ncbi:MAG: STELLO glycosyltransferase family protein [Alphaproteobacteria bacterium]